MVDFDEAHEDRAAERPSLALDQNIGQAHGTQVAHQMERRGIAHGAGVLIDHRQGEAGALHEGADSSDIGEGRDARRGTAGDRGFGCGEGLAQFAQRVTTEKGGEEQAVRLERAAHLGQCAGEVVSRVQCEDGDGEVKAFRRERQQFGVADGVGPGLRDAIKPNDAVDLAGGGEDGEGAADLGGDGELALHRRQSLGHVLGDRAPEEVGAGQVDVKRAPAAGIGQRMVEDQGRSAHGVRLWGGAWPASKAGDGAASRRAIDLPAMERTGDGIFDRTGKDSGAARIASAAAAVARRLIDLTLPPQCLACRAPVAEIGTLCPACWSRLRLIERPYCERLGIPFAYDLGQGALSAEAIADPPPFDRARAVAVYDDVARRLVHGLKYRDRLELARWMANWMARAGGGLVGAADVVVPVPLHRRRLWWRRYNQSALLAGVLAETAGKPVANDVLLRIRATAQQVGLTAEERDRNVRGAFRVTAEGKRRIAGRRVLLVDDVYTTGATVKAGTRALLRAGASAVDILTFARVVKGLI